MWEDSEGVTLFLLSFHQSHSDPTLRQLSPVLGILEDFNIHLFWEIVDYLMKVWTFKIFFLSLMNSLFHSRFFRHLVRATPVFLARPTTRAGEVSRDQALWNAADFLKWCLVTKVGCLFIIRNLNPLSGEVRGFLGVSNLALIYWPYKDYARLLVGMALTGGWTGRRWRWCSRQSRK